MDRRQPLMNKSERSTRMILKDVAERNGAEVFTKVRVADVLQLDHSGIDDELYRYGLQAHFDFVVADAVHMPLFAVEFDGPHHAREVQASARDRKKNTLCTALGLPLARVRDEHVFQKARGIDYLSWLTEMFFGARAIERAQAEGTFPEDEPVDPMMFISHPHVPGRFPLWLSAEARLKFERWRDAGALATSVPFGLNGYDAKGYGASLVVLRRSGGAMVVSESSIYLRGFGVSPAGAADEIATVNLAHLVENQAAESPSTTRRRIIEFLRCHSIGSWYSFSDPEFGFSIENCRQNGREQWTIGSLDNEPLAVITAPSEM